MDVETTTTISNLPPELLYDILDHLVTNLSATESRYALLLSTCLVAHSWREPSQAMLWRELKIEGVGDADQILASPLCGRFWSRALVVTSATDYGRPERLQGLDALLPKLRNLEDLRLWRVSPDNRFTVSGLEGDHLATECISELGLEGRFTLSWPTEKCDIGLQASDKTAAGRGA